MDGILKDLELAQIRADLAKAEFGTPSRAVFDFSSSEDEQTDDRDGFEYVYSGLESELTPRVSGRGHAVGANDAPIPPRQGGPFGSLNSLEPDSMPVADWAQSINSNDTFDDVILDSPTGYALEREVRVRNSELQFDGPGHKPLKIDTSVGQPVEHGGKKKGSPLKAFKWPFRGKVPRDAQSAPGSTVAPASTPNTSNNPNSALPPLPSTRRPPKPRPVSFFLPPPETPEPPIPHTPTLLKSRLKTTQVNQYLLLRELGRGVHGTVRLAYDTSAERTVAVKIVRAPKKSLLGAARFDVGREVAVLKKVSGFERCVGLLEVVQDRGGGDTYLVLEYMQGGSLEWQPSPPSYTPLWDEEGVKSVTRDVVLGLAFLHSKGIVHRDIKPANLLKDGQGRVKITDFGTSLWEGDGVGGGGTPAFWAPEMVEFGGGLPRITVTRASGVSGVMGGTQVFPSRRGSTVEKVDGGVDVWALGVTLFCLVTGRTPFSGGSEWVLFRKIREDPVVFPSGVQLSIAFRELLAGMMEKDPVERWSLERIALWPWTTAGMEGSEWEEWVGRVVGYERVRGGVEVGEEEVGRAVGVLERIKRRISTSFGKVFGRGWSADDVPPISSPSNRNSLNRFSLASNRSQSHPHVFEEKRKNRFGGVMRMISLPAVRNPPRPPSQPPSTTRYSIATPPRVIEPVGSRCSFDSEGDEEIVEGGEWSSLWRGTMLDDGYGALDGVEGMQGDEAVEGEGDDETTPVNDALADSHPSGVEGSSLTLSPSCEIEIGQGMRSSKSAEEQALADADEERRLAEWDRGVVYY